MYGLAGGRSLNHLELKTLLESHRFNFVTEAELQGGIAAALEGQTYTREHRLSRWDRPDFLVDGIAVEVKIDGSLANLTRQLHRYAGFDEVRALLVVTNLSRLADLPDSLNGKPVSVVLLRTL